MVKKLLLEVRKRLHRRETVDKMSVVTWKMEHVLDELVDLAKEGGVLPALALPPVFLMSAPGGGLRRACEQMSTLFVSEAPILYPRTSSHLAFSNWLGIVAEIILFLVVLSSSCATDELVLLSTSLPLDFRLVGCL